ncbi:prefoldin subunit 5 [Poecilia latipinna]|uniref:Prefoldin 5 n=1 Tax=Poecilia formosa TaxID=48698 RepID=A0A096LZZ2_POEFO|nr:PREDICTED: prefoldin subunit 5-like [Poecilia formosa]XP_014899385.1 PREDICTED: prefoldin subunit 5 [Poecilia latipinna]
MAVNLPSFSQPGLECFNELQQEAEFLVCLVRQLKDSQTRYAHSLESVEIMNRNRNGEFLVPLTSYMYVPGALNADHVLVNIGAGFHVEKSMKEAKAFLKRQIDLVSKQVEKVESVVEEKCLIIKGGKASIPTTGAADHRS